MTNEEIRNVSKEMEDIKKLIEGLELENTIAEILKLGRRTQQQNGGNRRKNP